jgi:hypothetical protein
MRELNVLLQVVKRESRGVLELGCPDLIPSKRSAPPKCIAIFTCDETIVLHHQPPFSTTSGARRGVLQ